jgi:hypothetical protein
MDVNKMLEDARARNAAHESDEYLWGRMAPDGFNSPVVLVSWARASLEVAIEQESWRDVGEALERLYRAELLLGGNPSHGMKQIILKVSE